MKNLISFLFISVICVIFIVAFKDIFRDGEFGIGIIGVILLLILVIFLMVCARYFFTLHRKKVSNLSVIFMFLAVLGMSFLVQKVIAVKSFAITNQEKRINPLWSEYLKIAKIYNLNLNFTKYVWEQRGPIDYMQHEIFKDRPKSIDILMFGDSSLAWGVIPKVIEQITGKKVRIYAYESNLLNPKSIKVFEKIAKFYLKDDGVLIYCFANWTQDKPQNELRISKDTYDKFVLMSDDEFMKFSQNSVQNDLFLEQISLKNYKKKIDDFSQFLANNYEISLISKNFYFDFIEPVLNRQWHEKKIKNSNKNGRFLRFDMNTITQYNSNFKQILQIDDNYKIDPNFGNENFIKNTTSAKTIKSKTRIYMQPFFAGKSSFWVNVYEKYYKNDDFIFADLSQYAVQIQNKTGMKVLMEGKTHTGNSGGLLMSIAIGQWLRDNLN